ncbi:hypothetical protein DXT90_21745, partial [Agrobacterium tumefaciens]|nr:hypothetical protein [Agrobacterium tumefaciens]
FLFLLIFNCQKTDTNQVSKNQTPQATKTQEQQAIAHLFRFSLEQRTSSPAAPPPSSVSGLIRDTPQTSQQTFFNKIHISCKSLFQLDNFHKSVKQVSETYQFHDFHRGFLRESREKSAPHTYTPRFRRDLILSALLNEELQQAGDCVGIAAQKFDSSV